MKRSKPSYHIYVGPKLGNLMNILDEGIKKISQLMEIMVVGIHRKYNQLSLEPGIEQT